MKTWNKVFLTVVIVSAGIATNGIARAKGKGHRPQRGGEVDVRLASKEDAPQLQHPPLNVCGCYSKNGACVCTTHTLKCECPGECESLGCEAKRQKQIDRELAQETKRIQEEDRKRDEAEKAKQAKSAESDGQAE
jgi:hypothetical protein